MLHKSKTSETTAQMSHKVVATHEYCKKEPQPKQYNKTTTTSYNENVFITSLLLSLFMQCNTDCGHPFIDARSEVTNTFALRLLKEATTNQYFCHRILNFKTNNQQYFI